MTTQTSSDILPKISTYPRIIIQHDWSVDLKLNTLPADLWLEFKAGSSSLSRITQNIHGVCSIKASIDQEAKVYKTSSSDKFQSNDIDKKKQQLRIKMQDSEFSHTFQGPTKSFSTSSDRGHAEFDPLINVPELPKNRTHQSPITTYPHWFDISSGGVGLTALNNGTITIWDINSGQVRRTLKGHTEDVYISRFFPSDFAVVSGGADMRVKIWSLDSENNQIRDATLSGHRSRINDVHALDHQRVLSASNDGSVILWDLTRNEPINRVVHLDNTSINAISFTDSSSIACACDDGSIRFYDFNRVASSEMIHEIKIGAPVSTLCHLSDTKQIIYGTEQSVIGIHDTRQLTDAPIYVWKEQRGKINCIVPSRDHSGILATTADGSCLEYNQEELKSMSDTLQFHVSDYTGANDSILNGKIFQGKVYSICRDGFIRVYDNQA